MFALGKPFRPSLMCGSKAGAGNTEGGSIIVPLTSGLTGLDLSVLRIKQKLLVVIQLISNQSNRR